MTETKKLAPTFVAQSTQGPIDFATLRGKKVVLYFYPKDNTSGCTLEGQNFSAMHDEFVKHDAVVIGVSRDSIKSHQNFCTKQGFPFALISDPEEALCQAYDVMKLKKMYGREYMGVERSTFLIDREGFLAQEWRKVKVPGHVQAVLDAVIALG
ncbi:MAG: peroxiredoxin [Burkholderiaceae bacterium]|nr:peroxiredoxin [Burkholderiaceae bacterium]